VTEGNHDRDDATRKARGERGDRDLRRSKPGAHGSQEFHVARAHASQGEHRKKQPCPEKRASQAPPGSAHPAVDQMEQERGGDGRKGQHVRNPPRAQIRHARKGQNYADENV